VELVRKSADTDAADGASHTESDNFGAPVLPFAAIDGEALSPASPRARALVTWLASLKGPQRLFDALEKARFEHVAQDMFREQRDFRLAPKMG
jgi:hypothetical protein